MVECSVEIAKMPGNEDLPLPHYATPEAAGLDIYSANKEDIVIKPFERCLVPTGIKIALPMGYEMQIRPRSGLAYKHGISVLNSPGTIDSDYRGEIKILLINFGNEDFIIERGMRIAQGVVTRHEQVKLQLVSDLSESTRGEGGFGHSGTK